VSENVGARSGLAPWVWVSEEVSVFDPILGFDLSGESIDDIVRGGFVGVQVLGGPLGVGLGRFRT
jgi:hypothetical protein